MKKGKNLRIKRCVATMGICALIGSFTSGCSTYDTNVTSAVDTGTESSRVSEDLTGQSQELVIGPCEEAVDREAAGDISFDAGAQGFSKALFAQSLDETNPIESPLSAFLAMALAGEGAEGDTAAEFDAVMGQDRQAMSEQFMKSFPSDAEGTKVALANSAWLDDRLIYEADWRKTAADIYLAEVYQTRLSTGETMGKINAWVEQNTQGLIKNLLDQPLDDMTRLALFNTIYFKGQWQSAFDGEHTAKEDFTLADGTKVQADMMRRTGKMSYVQGEAYDGVALPYRDSELLFVALRPTGGQNVRELYEDITFEQLGEAVDAAQNVQVNLWLPKFKVTFDRILNGDLMHMGLTKAFDADQADFSGIGKADIGDLYISLVRQKAVFIVDEEGTEAAAVTEVIMRTNSMMPVEEPKLVHFDEPFLYMILDPETDMPLFVGIMDDPSQVQE